MAMPEAARLSPLQTPDRALDLHAADGCWIVEEGHLDLFAIEPNPGRAEGGRRRPLFTLPAGALVCALGPASEGLRLLAVPSLGARWRALERPPDEGERDGWVVRLLRAVVPPGPGDLDRTGQPGRCALRAGDRLGGGRSACWLRVATGELSLGGCVPLAPGDPPLICLEPLWAEAVAATVVEVDDAPPRGEPGLAGLHRFFCRTLAKRIAEDAAAETCRLEQRALHEADAVSFGLGLLAAQVGNGRPPGAVPLAVGDPVAAALAPVLVHLGLPPEAVADAPGTIEEAIAAAALRGRRVLLRDAWERDSAEPLVGFLGPARQPVALLPGRRWRLRGLDLDEPLTAPLAEALALDGWQFYRALAPEPQGFRDLVALGLRRGGGDGLRAGLLGLATALAGLAFPLALDEVFSNLIPDGDRAAIMGVIAALVVATLAQGAFQIGNALALLRLETRFEINASPALMDRLLRLPTRFFRIHNSGDLVDRLLGIQQGRAAITAGLKSLQVAAIVALVSLALLLSYSIGLGALALALAALVAGSDVVTSRIQLGHVRRYVMNRGRLDGFVLQLIVGIAKLRGAAAERRAMAQWAEGFAHRVEQTGLVQWWAVAQRILDDTLPVLATAAMFGAIVGWSRGLGTGAVIAFAAGYGQLLAALSEISRALAQIAAAVPLLERARPLLAATPETRAQAEPLGWLDGAIGLRNLSFRYTDSGPLILDNISLDVPAGSFVALVGPSGSGKSTIFRTLLGFETPTAGEVLFDGRASDRIDPVALRRQIGVVLQNGRISSGSILDNILGPAPLKVGDAWAAARMVGLAQDIEAMPMGMQTVLLDGGATLSGGQRQRLLIARAIVHNPRILLFDEATSALDNRSQAIVTATLRKLAITRVVIAHRLSTVAGADIVFVIDGGRLVQQGRYADLIAVAGPFADLAKRQMG